MEEEEEDWFQSPPPAASNAARPATKRAKLVKPALDSAIPQHLVGQNWAFKHAPQTVEDLKTSVPMAKITEVEEAIADALQPGSAHPLVVIHGPPGSGKTACLQVLAKKLRVDLMEWEDNNGANQAQQFERFLIESCYPCLRFTSSKSNADQCERKIVLVETLPELGGKQILLDVLGKIVSGRAMQVCICFVYTTPGESKSALTKLQLGDIVGTESVMYFCKNTLHFNPIAGTRMSKTLSKIAKRENLPPAPPLARDDQQLGDLRNALNNLEFRTNSSSSVASSRRDESLDMLHAVGKLLRGPKPDTVLADFDYEAIARKCCLDVPMLGAFVFENYYKYASPALAGVETYLRVAESCALAEELRRSKWNSLERSGAGEDEDEYDAMDALGESLIARSASAWLTRDNNPITFPHMIQIQRPQNLTATSNAKVKLRDAQAYLRPRRDLLPARTFLTQVLPLSSKIGRSRVDALLSAYTKQVEQGSSRQSLTHLDDQYEDDLALLDNAQSFAEDDVVVDM